ncbi:hypothetical protein [Actinoplanes sp. TFC3]|uniref:hypothetical protein n=1 Tax=Actinoplanes sp. TFC3 TaxID=1710355 RepID=UPI000834C2E2|nr:hypothetical protein [Actinoplanes sp. TFC3]
MSDPYIPAPVRAKAAGSWLAGLPARLTRLAAQWGFTAGRAHEDATEAHTAAAIWEWGVADRVATGLTLTGIGLEPVAGQTLRAADALSG